VLSLSSLVIPLWLRFAVAGVLAGIVALGGYKIGVWREAAAGAADAKTASEQLAACNTSLAAQRESTITGANHALEDQLRDASTLARADADRLADLAKKMQGDALTFSANTRAIYATAAGSCTLTPDFVRLLRQAADQANAANRYRSGDKAASGKTDSGNASPSPVPNSSGRSRPAAEGKAGDHPRSPVQ
jgi:type IV secretory pathway VirJ component